MPPASRTTEIQNEHYFNQPVILSERSELKDLRLYPSDIVFHRYQNQTEVYTLRKGLVGDSEDILASVVI